jgi:hypothetical protein
MGQAISSGDRDYPAPCDWPLGPPTDVAQRAGVCARLRVGTGLRQRRRDGDHEHHDDDEQRRRGLHLGDRIVLQVPVVQQQLHAEQLSGRAEDRLPAIASLDGCPRRRLYDSLTRPSTRSQSPVSGSPWTHVLLVDRLRRCSRVPGLPSGTMVITAAEPAPTTRVRGLPDRPRRWPWSPQRVQRSQSAGAASPSVLPTSTLIASAAIRS